MKKLSICITAIFLIFTVSAQDIMQSSKDELIHTQQLSFENQGASDYNLYNDLSEIQIPYSAIHNSFYRISLRIGGGPYYHYGIIEYPKGVNLKLFSLQGEGMIGYNFKNDHWPIHTAAVFTRRGFTSRLIDPAIIYDQELPEYEYDENENFNNFEEYEAGLLIGRWFRVSGGMGNQKFRETNGRVLIFDYYTFTSGFCFGNRHARMSLNFTAAGGNDYQNLHFRLYAGMNFYLNFLKI